VETAAAEEEVVVVEEEVVVVEVVAALAVGVPAPAAQPRQAAHQSPAVAQRPRPKPVSPYHRNLRNRQAVPEQLGRSL
jgi:hypothetical protein